MAYENGENKVSGYKTEGLEQFLIWVREDIAGEIGAIDNYQYHIDSIDIPEIKEILSHIRDDEKEHLAELTNLLRRFDATQNLKFENDHFAGGTKSEEAAGGFTVGNA
ncbi:MAG: demethoxyubiquinone hydroxylase family protein [Thermoanaerobacteraceae bacterium]|nr:demethoxyubiquinone hydroxylase family protein [Thermoanaerobacteraceae bacterium]